MLIKTKSYKLDTKEYIKIAMVSLLKKEWWYIALPIAIILPTFWIPSGWWWTGGISVLVGYLLFWLIQFTGITQMEQGKILFEKLYYEITSQQILIKVNAKQGMPLKWDQIKLRLADRIKLAPSFLVKSYLLSRYLCKCFIFVFALMHNW